MKVAPSILSCLNGDIDKLISKLNKIGLTYLHLDVMDGIFVPNKTFDFKLVKKIKQSSNLIIDTHLMIDKPEDTIDEYINTKSDYLCFHYEATNKHQEIINKIKANNLKVGMSVKPNTDIAVLKPYLKDLDLVLVMSVEPGFGGQKFMENMLSKVEYLSKEKKANNYQYLIEIDGGINGSNKDLVKEKGVELAVVGTYFFSTEDLKARIKEFED